MRTNRILFQPSNVVLIHPLPLEITLDLPPRETLAIALFCREDSYPNHELCWTVVV